MKNYFVGMTLASVLGVLVFSLGCSEDPNARKASAVAKENILVQVNDHILTKADMATFFELSEAHIARMSPQARHDAMSRLPEEKMRYIPTFVEEMLLMDDAFRLNVLTPEDLEKKVQVAVERLAESNKKSVKDYLKSLGSAADVLRRSAKKRIVVNAYVQHQFPEHFALSGETVSNYLALIKSEKMAAIATNAVRFASLEKIRADFAAGKIKAKFADYAEKHSDDSVDLGEMGRIDFVGNPGLADEVFALKKGAISRVLEEDDHYYILYIKDFIPAVRDERGEVTDPEKRHLLRIVKTKMDFPVEFTYEEAYRDLRYQFMTKALKERVDQLKTNGIHKIIWPNGTNNWKMVFAPEQPRSKAP